MPTMYNLDLNLAFIHIPKCAGSTVSIYLKAGKDGPGEVRPLYDVSILSKADSIGWVEGSSIEGLIKTVNLNNAHTSYRLLHTDHARAQDIRQHIGVEVYDSMDSFTVVRDPWTRIESMYHYIRKNSDNPRHELAHSLSFEDFVWWHCDNACSPQSEWIFGPDGEQLVKTIVQPENLNSYLSALLQSLFGTQIEVEKWNTSASAQLPKFHGYQGVMPETLDKIRKSYAVDFDLLGFSLEKPEPVNLATPISKETLRTVTDAFISNNELLETICADLALDPDEVLSQHSYSSSRTLYNSAASELQALRQENKNLRSALEHNQNAVAFLKSKLASS